MSFPAPFIRIGFARVDSLKKFTRAMKPYTNGTVWTSRLPITRPALICLVEESIFKLITNPSAFLSLHWTKQREFLFQIAGTITDAQIAATDPKFASLLELVNGKKLAEFKKEIAAKKKKKAKKNWTTLQPRIDQTAKLDAGSA